MPVGIIRLTKALDTQSATLGSAMSLGEYYAY